MIQLAVSLLILVPLLWPVTEFFDRWDAPGLDNDIEIALFAVLFLLGLILLLAKLLSRLESIQGHRVLGLTDLQGIETPVFAWSAVRTVIPCSSPPLRV